MTSLSQAVERLRLPLTVEEIENYGAFGDTEGRFTSYAIVDADGRTLFDTVNSDCIEVHEEHDEESHFAWDEEGRRNAEALVALVNSSTARLSSPTGEVREGAKAIAWRFFHFDREADQAEQLSDAIARFVTAREAGKDAEIERYEAHLHKVEVGLKQVVEERARLAARLEKMEGAARAVVYAPYSANLGAIGRLAATLADEDGSTPVPASETAMHDGSEE